MPTPPPPPFLVSLLRAAPALVALAALRPPARAEVPAWAYPVAPAVSPVPAAPNQPDLPRQVPGSAVTLTERQFAAHVTAVPDWHPEEHPPMPPIVRVGREPQVWACAYCHLPNGAGRPENASLAGLTPAYLRQQLADFREGRRAGSEPRRGPQGFMIALSKALSPDETEQAVAYFSALKPVGFVTVVESDTVPRSYVAGAMLAAVPGGGTEPLAGRIIEMPRELARAENRDSRTPYVAYVPVGSVRRGEALANHPATPGAFACSLCHGPGLRGMADFPRLAGRSPSYLMRQLFDFKAGTRTGATGLMRAVVAGLSQSDMVDLTAYLASLPP